MLANPVIQSPTKQQTKAEAELPVLEPPVSGSSVRVAIAGDVAVGKTTLIQVLSHGDNDCTHATSHRPSATLDSVHIAYSSLSPPTVVSSTDPSVVKTVQLLSLSGQPTSLKQSLHAMTCMCPDYMMLLIDSTVGITTSTRQFLGLAIAMRLQIVVIMTKIDLCAPAERETRTTETKEWIQACTHKSVQQVQPDTGKPASHTAIPLFLVSTETKEGILRLHELLSSLSPSLEAGDKDGREGRGKDLRRVCGVEVWVRQVHNVPHTGTVLVGLLKSGRLKKEQTLQLGPIEGAFQPVLVKSIHVAGADRSICQGHTEVAIHVVAKGRKQLDAEKLKRNKGLMLVARVDSQRLVKAFDAVVISLGKGICKAGQLCTLHSGPTRKPVRVSELIGNTALQQGEKGGLKFEFLKGCAYMSPGDFAIFRENGIILFGVVTQLYPIP